MKLLLDKVLIETDYIEIVEKVGPHTVKIVFVSGSTLEVHCGIRSSSSATWHQDAEGFIQTIENTNYPTLRKGNST